MQIVVDGLRSSDLLPLKEYIYVCLDGPMLQFYPMPDLSAF